MRNCWLQQSGCETRRPLRRVQKHRLIIRGVSMDKRIASTTTNGVRDELTHAEAELTAAAGRDDMAMDRKTRNHVVAALEYVQAAIEQVNEGND